MAKVTLTDIESIQNEGSVVAAYNANNAAIEVAMDKALFRDGTSPNPMLAQLDMNSNRIINLPQAVNGTEPVRYGDIQDTLDAMNAALDIIENGIVEGTASVCVTTRDSIQSLTVNALIGFLYTAGYHVVGDGGHALYKRVLTEPAHMAKVQSLDGAWWEIVGTDFDSRALDVFPDTGLDRKAQIQAAINVGAKRIRFPGGTYIITPGGSAISAISNQVLEGAGDGITIFKINAAPTAQVSIIEWVSKSNFMVKNLTFDYSDINYSIANPTWGVGFVGCGSCTNFIFDSVGFINQHKFGMTFSGVSKCRIKNCRFIRNTADPTFLNSAVIFTNALSSKVYFTDNFVEKWGLGMENLTHLICRGNIIDGFGYGSGISGGDVTKGANYFIITENMTFNGSTELTDLELGGLRSGGIEIYTPNSVCALNISAFNGGEGIHQGGPFSATIGNIAVANGQRSLVPGAVSPNQFAGFALRRIDDTNQAEHSTFVGNVSNNATNSQSWALIASQNPSYLNIFGNSLDNGVIAPVNIGTGNYRGFVGTALTGSAVWDPAPQVAGNAATTTFPFAGAQLGDHVTVSLSNTYPGAIVTGQVISLSTVEVNLYNASGVSQNLGSVTVYMTIHKGPNAAIF